MRQLGPTASFRIKRDNLAMPSPVRSVSEVTTQAGEEQGYTDFVALPCLSLSAPAGTPPSLLYPLEKSSRAAFGSAEAQA